MAEGRDGVDMFTLMLSQTFPLACARDAAPE